MELRIVTDKPATLRRGRTTQYPRLGGNHHECSHQHYDCFVELVMHAFLSYRLTCFTLSLFSPGVKFYPVVWCTEGLGRRNYEGTPPSGSKFKGAEYRCQIWWFLSGGGW